MLKGAKQDGTFSFGSSFQLLIINFGQYLCSLDLENHDDSELLTNLIRLPVVRLRAPGVGLVSFRQPEEEILTFNLDGYSLDFN